MKRAHGREVPAPGGAAQLDVFSAARAAPAFETGPVVMHRGFREARDQVLSMLASGCKLILLAGPAGVGKSLLLKEIARSLRFQDNVDVLVEAHDTLSSATLAWVGELSARQHGPRRQVVMVDEAFRVDPAAIDRLEQYAHCAFVLADLDRGRLCSTAPRLPPGMTAVRLHPLTLDEAEAFVIARMIQLGMTADAISREAAMRIAGRSGGLPSTLNALSSAALRLAQSERAHRVEVRHVERAATALSPPEHDRLAGDAPTKRQRRHGIARTLAQVGAVALAGSALLLWHTERVWHTQAGVDDTIVASGTAVQAASKPALIPAFTADASATPADHGEMACKVGVATTACSGIVRLQGAPVDMLAGEAAPASPPSSKPFPVVERSPTPASPPPTLPLGDEAASAMGAPKGAGSVPDEPDPKPRAAEAPPSRALVRVVLRYSPSASGAETRVKKLAKSLRAAGYTVNTAADHVVPVEGLGGARYFHAEDQASAGAVLKAAGMSGQATMISAPTSRLPGLIELILPAEPVEAASRP